MTTSAAERESEAIIARFMAKQTKRIDLSLDRIERLLARLDHPERRLPPVIHVAGTNGKGSTVALMRACLESAGLGVHVDTSPHLVNFRERIRLAAPGGGRLVDPERMLDVLRHCEAVNEAAPITVWELITATAFVLFADSPADVLLLEVGLGGRLDATNVVTNPLVSVITSISMDHADWLGNTVELIAAEKAGILKRGAPGVIYPQTDSVRAVIEAAARRIGAPLFIGGQDFEAREENGRLIYQDERGLMDLPLPRLPGRHQHRNAGVAIAALRVQGLLKLTDADFARGMRHVEWPARLQRLSTGRIVEIVPNAAEIWLDGAHNPDGGRVLAEALAEREDIDPRPLVMVTGMLSTKDPDGFLENFAGLVRHVHTVPIGTNTQARPPEEVAATARRAGLEATAHESLESALFAIARETAGEAPRLIIAGSLYLAGEVLAYNGTVPQ